MKAKAGQAIVEATLGILVFISVLMFGIHFSEITFTQMKVTEAAQSAVWDATAGEMHVLPDIAGSLFGNFNGAGNNVTTAMGDANNRYMDFDGRTAVAGNPSPKQILSSARPGSMNVQCNINAGLGQRGAHFALILHEAVAYRDNDGYRCQADAWIEPFGSSPSMRVGSFLEDANGFFGGTARAQHKNSVTQTNGYHICAVNKANGLNGPCRGEFAGLIDDWGMASGGNEEDTCPVVPYGIPCFGFNTNFWTSAMLMYQLNAILGTQNRAEYDIVSLVNRPPVWAWPGIPLLPGNPTSFYLSFYGEATLFVGFLPWAGDLSLWFWWTTPSGLYFPSYTVAHTVSKGFYLGKDANVSSIQNP